MTKTINKKLKQANERQKTSRLSKSSKADKITRSQEVATGNPTITAFDKEWQKTVEIGISNFGVRLSSHQLDLLAMHAEELIKWNSRFNITAIVEPFDVALKHFIDSIAVSPLIPDGSKVVDLGSGGGFPGIPLKVVNPSLEVVMVDSSRKKVNFINDIIRKTGLSGAKAIHCRAEQLAKEPEYAHQFDFAVSRAFTALNGFTEMALLFIKNTGTLLAMKGELKTDELTPVRNRKDITTTISEYTLPFEHHKRSIVKIKLTDFYQG